MNKKIAEIEQDGVRFALWRIEGEGYTIFQDGKKTNNHITAPNEEIAEGYFENYVEAMRRKIIAKGTRAGRLSVKSGSAH